MKYTIALVLLLCIFAAFLLARAPDILITLTVDSQGQQEPSITIENHSGNPVHALCFAECEQNGQWVQEVGLELDANSAGCRNVMKASVLKVKERDCLRVAWSKAIWKNAPPHRGRYRIGVWLVDPAGDPLLRFPFLTWIQGENPLLMPPIYSPPMEIAGTQKLTSQSLRTQFPPYESAR